MQVTKGTDRYLSMRELKPLYRLSTAATHCLMALTCGWPFSTRLSATCIISFTRSRVSCSIKDKTTIQKGIYFCHNLLIITLGIHWKSASCIGKCKSQNFIPNECVCVCVCVCRVIFLATTTSSVVNPSFTTSSQWDSTISCLLKHSTKTFPLIHHPKNWHCLTIIHNINPCSPEWSAQCPPQRTGI